MLPPGAGPQAPMMAPGTWFSPLRGGTAVPATASPSPCSAAACHQPEVAGSRAWSIAPGRLRSGFRLAHPGQAAVAGSPAATAQDPGAASSAAIVAAAPGRRRGAERAGYGNENGPPDLTGRLIAREFNSARRQYHHDLAAFETRVLLDLGELGDVGLDLVEQLGADLLVRHFAAAIAQGDLDLVAFFEEPLHGAHLHFVIVVVDHRAELDLLDLDDLLPLAGFGGFFLRGILILPVVHDLADGRADVRRDLDQIHAGLLGHADGRNS